MCAQFDRRVAKTHKPTKNQTLKFPIDTSRIQATDKMLSTTILFALTLTGALAAPAPALEARGEIAADQSSCKGYQSTWNMNESIYQVVVGRPYLGGDRCPEIKSKVSAIYDLKRLKCSGSSKNKNTKLTIVSNMSQDNQYNINKALHNAYPEITFNCDTNLSMDFK
ncbi:hypothetical protein CLAFUW4_14728 [Fulvia fulva]|uniref:Uncharacterized protein n=1 Tax=Passalora fulva TaxID=5499 RepID=A0A9Q8UWS2_PASFU|nr:uncharacterized protein CLAFUR5_14555 [Fulvia fulva]UJO25285.1 hypothetical protein CLAFUR5_14555 [Fulvia fulva]WPV22813.1 hypothetical protein CLAFUW4_14728 [Fulvia fulva]